MNPAKTKILVIEDEISIRLGTTTLLGTSGLFEVQEAENGKIGVDIAAAFKPDLIICDVNMPELDGYGVLESVRSNSQLEQTPFIFLTANATKQDIRRGMESGADDYLTKPFKRDELFNAVNKRLEKARLQREAAERRIGELRSTLSQSLPHELLTPLIGIIGSSDILLHHAADLTTDDIRESGAQIKESALRLQHTIENFIVLSHMNLAATNPVTVAAMQAETTTMANSLIPEIAAKQCRLHNRPSSSVRYTAIDSPAIAISEQLFWKAVEEVISNAVKFSEPDSEILLTESQTETAWSLTVTNMGIGLSDEQIQHIGAFMQFNRSVNEQQGSGLGLAIASVICSIHNGSLDITSIPNEQTTVTITFPRVG